MKRFIRSALILLIGLFLAEGGLRLQQTWGPLIDLEFMNLDEHTLSYEVHHKPGPQEDYDPDGIQRNRERMQLFPGNLRPLRVLFMGDERMQGNPPAQTIPQYTLEALQSKTFRDRPLLFLNAGYRGYSPLIYTVQARKLIPKHRPDAAVVLFDESDLVEDYAVYAPLAAYRTDRTVKSVKPFPADESRQEGISALRDQPFYLLRLLRLGLEQLKYRRAREAYEKSLREKYSADSVTGKSAKYPLALAPIFNPSESSDYAPEKEAFFRTLRDFALTLKEQMGGTDKILFIYYPHLYQMKADSRGVLWRQIIPETIEKVSEETGIEFYNPVQDLIREFGVSPDQYYREQDLSLYPNGLQIYSRLLASRLEKKLLTPPASAET